MNIKNIHKHKKKLGGAVTLATLITALQLYGALAPMLCHLPFIHDTQACLDSAKRVVEVAKGLDSMTLDAGVLP